MRSTLIILTTLALLAGCGDDGEPKRTAATAEPAAAAIPQELIGTWTAEIKTSEIPDAPNEFNEAVPRWEMTILADGGVDGAPSLTVSNEGVGPAWSLTPKAADGTLTLDEPSEQCNGGAKTHEFTYTLDGDELTLVPADVRRCPDPLMETMLSLKPWRRS